MTTETTLISTPTIIARDEHTLSRSLVSENALKVLYRLKNSGYSAHLVGGCVRDLLLGREPKDFDIATNALPEQVKELFRNCRLIGRRFRLAHVHFGQEIVEVATFRAGHDEAEKQGAGEMRDGMIVRDNVYGNIEQDAWRRDFTVNALYYNVEDFSVVDYTGGMADLRAGVLRTIGDPLLRFREDPVRMLRAIRFAAKLGFRIDPAAEHAIGELRDTLVQVPPARLFDEMQKLFMAGYAVATYELLRHYHLFEYLFPQEDAALAVERDGFPQTLILRGLENTDRRVNDGKSVTPAFLFAVLLWDAMRARVDELVETGMNEHDAQRQATQDVVHAQSERVAIPRRFSSQAAEIWAMQPRLDQRFGRRPVRTLEHPRFRAGYDFLLLRAAAGQVPAELGEWWTAFQQADEAGRDALLHALPKNDGGGPRRRRRSRRGRGGARNSGDAPAQA